MPLNVDEFIGTLMLYEAENVNDLEDRKGKKSIILKSNISNDRESNSKEEEEGDEKLVLMVKKFRNMTIKKKKL